jgi:hypothetical protein
MTSPEPLTIGDLSTIKVSGAKNYLALDPAARLVYVVGLVGEGYPEEVWHGRHMLLAPVPVSVVEDGLREYLSARMESVESIARGYLGQELSHAGNRVGHWSEDAHEEAHAFREELGAAVDSGDVPRAWDAGDWCAFDWASCMDRAGKAGDLVEWAFLEAADAKSQGVHLDTADLVRVMTARLERTLSELGDAALIEWMPESLRESHTAARNAGSYPHNGAERFVGSREHWEYLAQDEEEGEWIRVLRAATVEDLRVFGVR